MLTHRILSALSKFQKNLVRQSSTFKPKISPLSLHLSAVNKSTIPSVFCKQPRTVVDTTKRHLSTTTAFRGTKISANISDDDAVNAVTTHDWTTLEEYLKTNDVNKIVTFYGTYHATLLHLACYHADTVAMSYLFSKGADANSKDVDEAKPLHFVMISGESATSKAAAIDSLLAQNADINAVDISLGSNLDI